MYSLLFVSLVKPQYKMYCDLVAQTGKKLPHDFNVEEPAAADKDDEPAEEDDVAVARKFFSPFTDWGAKFSSFLCCKRPQGDD